MPGEDVVGLVRWLAPRLSLLFGIGFLGANIWVAWQLFSYRRRRRSAHSNSFAMLTRCSISFKVKRAR